MFLLKLHDLLLNLVFVLFLCLSDGLFHIFVEQFFVPAAYPV